MTIMYKFELLLILQLNIYLVYSYKIFTLESADVCPPTGKQPAIFLSSSNSKSGLLIKQTNIGINSMNCVFNVKTGENSLKRTLSKPNDGIIIMIQSLALRRKPNGECIDYVQFKTHKDITRRFCGIVKNTINLGEYCENSTIKNEGIIDWDGHVETIVHIDKQKPELGEYTDINIVYTSFKDCFKNSINYSSCSMNDRDHNSICIFNDFFNDDIINCPSYTKCTGNTDISTCKIPTQTDCNRLMDNPIYNRSYRSGDSKRISSGLIIYVTLASMTVAFLTFFACLWCWRQCKKCCCCRVCRKKPNHPRIIICAQDVTPPIGIYPEYSLGPISNSNPTHTTPEVIVPLQSQQTNLLSNAPTAPPTEEVIKDLPPSYESLFSNSNPNNPH